jgi:hypothetical protein
LLSYVKQQPGDGGQGDSEDNRFFYGMIEIRIFLKIREQVDAAGDRRGGKYKD